MLACLRQFKAPVFSHDKLRSDLILKCLYGSRNAGLGDMAQLRRFCKAVLLNNRLEMLYLAQHHSTSPLTFSDVSVLLSGEQYHCFDMPRDSRKNNHTGLCCLGIGQGRNMLFGNCSEIQCCSITFNHISNIAKENTLIRELSVLFTNKLSHSTSAKLIRYRFESKSFIK